MKSKFILLTFILTLLTSCGIQINEQAITSGISTTTVIIDQTDDDNLSTGFGGGIHTGTTYSSDVLTLNTATNNSELDESWTPKYSNIIAYYNLNESTQVHNSTISAVIGNDGLLTTNDGTTNKSISGKLNNATSFDGVDDRIVATGYTNLNFTGAFTLMAWVKSNTTGGGGTIVSTYQGCGACDGFQFYHDPNGGGTYRFYVYENQSAPLVRSNDPPNLKWTHLMGVRDGAGNIEFYINGVKQTTTAVDAATFVDNASEIRIGGQLSGSNINGSIDEIAIWNTNLSSEEIQLIYQRQISKFSGEMRSRIIDSQDSNSQWRNLNWITTLPFGKELPTTSESSNEYSSLVGTTGSINDDDLNIGLVGLWHLNETAAGQAPSGLDAEDVSGNENHHTATGVVDYQCDGRFSSGACFDTGAEFNTQNLDLSSNYHTFCSWFSSTNTSSSYGMLGHMKTGFTPNAHIIFNRNHYLSGHDAGKLAFHYRTGGQFNGASTSDISSFWADGKFHHLCVKNNLPERTIEIYLDGISYPVTYYNDPTAPGPLNFNSPITIGAANTSSTAGRTSFKGAIDEVAIWTRALSEQEIIQLYRRGANRIKYQVRSCASADCSDQDALTGDGWKGPGGNYLTYFSELQNNSNVTATCSTIGACYSSELLLQGDVGAVSPSVNFSNFTTDGLLGINNNRYFQYRVIMESDDENTACDSGTATCMPELKSVTIGPAHSYEE